MGDFVEPRGHGVYVSPSHLFRYFLKKVRMGTLALDGGDRLVSWKKLHACGRKKKAKEGHLEAKAKELKKAKKE